MRLTLRTLLAYLDDTLDPNEIKQIGQKVAESDAAQELVARLRQVTRRRRLTTPPATGPGSFEPNTVSEYLDNTLSGEQIAEVEKLCLESDVHLAEIAACHQILTLILGEPALVPPSARKRMYALVRGRESRRSRRPVSAAVRTHAEEAPPPAPEPEQGEDTMLLGLPSYGKQPGWIKWALAGTVVLILGILGLAFWSALPPSGPTFASLPVRAAPSTETGTGKETRTEPKDTKSEPKDTVTEPKETASEPKATKPEAPKQTTPAIKDADADKERREIGRAVLVSKPYPNLLLARQKGKEDWQLVAPERPVYTSDTLVALPGYRAGIRHHSGAELFLWGSLPDLLPLVPLLESSLVLNNKSDVDLDLTLSSGRVLLSNTKEAGPLKARVTFNEEAGKPVESWEVTLEPGAEVAMDLLGRYDPDTPFNSGEGPLSLLYFVILKGQVKIKIDRQTLSPPADVASYLEWTNKGPGVRGPLPLDPKSMQPWDKRFAETPQANEARRALEELLLRRGTRTIEVLLEESLTSDKPPTRTLAVYCLGALENLSKLLDVLADQEERLFPMREAAIGSLRHWTGHRLENDKKLYDFLVNVKKFKERDANTTMVLLHSFSNEQLRQPETWAFLISCIRDKKPIIRELSYWHLVRQIPTARGRNLYPGGSDSDQPERAFAEWKKLVPDGALPKSGGGGSGPPR